MVSSAAEPQKVTNVEGITEYKLDNGLQLLLFPDSSQPKVTVNLTILTGSRHEGYGETGMAHLLEHLVFKGTPTHANVPKALRNRGASFNGSTSSDRTNYYETLPATDDNLEFAIRFEADRLVNSYVRREDLLSEMTVVRNEFERSENSPQNLLGNRMMAAAFDWHNYSKTTIGTNRRKASTGAPRKAAAERIMRKKSRRSQTETNQRTYRSVLRILGVCRSTDSARSKIAAMGSSTARASVVTFSRSTIEDERGCI